MATPAKKKQSRSRSAASRPHPARSKKLLLSPEGARRLASQARRLRHYRKWLTPKKKAMKKELQSFTDSPDWRIFRIMAEFIDGFEFLDRLTGEVTIFGSARADVSDEYYQHAKRLGYLLGSKGYTVITGGGPGIMEAANWGAYEAGGESVGLDIELPTEQRRNQFVTRSIGFHHFFTRKVMLSASSQAYVFFPGGFGTMDEMSEMVTLVQTEKIPGNVPCILFGSAFWGPLIDWVRKTVYEDRGYIARKDIGLLRVVDTPEEAMRIIRKTVERPYGSHMMDRIVKPTSARD